MDYKQKNVRQSWVLSNEEKEKFQTNLKKNIEKQESIKDKNINSNNEFMEK